MEVKFESMKALDQYNDAREYLRQLRKKTAPRIPMEIKGWQEGDLYFLESDGGVTVRNGGLNALDTTLLGVSISLQPGESFYILKPDTKPWWDDKANNPMISAVAAKQKFFKNDVVNDGPTQKADDAIDAFNYSLKHVKVNGEEHEIVDYKPPSPPKLPPVEAKKRRKMSLGRYR